MVPLGIFARTITSSEEHRFIKKHYVDIPGRMEELD